MNIKETVELLNYAIRQANYGKEPLKGASPSGASDCCAISPVVFEEEAQKLSIPEWMIASVKDALSVGDSDSGGLRTKPNL